MSFAKQFISSARRQLSIGGFCHWSVNLQGGSMQGLVCVDCVWCACLSVCLSVDTSECEYVCVCVCLCVCSCIYIYRVWSWCVWCACVSVPVRAWVCVCSFVFVRLCADRRSKRGFRNSNKHVWKVSARSFVAQEGLWSQRTQRTPEGVVRTF